MPNFGITEVSVKIFEINETLSKITNAPLD
ncbi:hypothetical protein [Salinicoccus albus]